MSNIGLRKKSEFNTNYEYVEYVRRVSEEIFKKNFNDKTIGFGECILSSEDEDRNKKFDVKINLNKIGLTFTGNIKDIQNDTLEKYWKNPTRTKNYSIKLTDIESKYLDTFIFTEYILDDSQNTFVRSYNYFFILRTKVLDIIENYKNNNIEYYKINKKTNEPYLLIKLEDIKNNSIKLEDFCDLNKIKKYFNILDNITELSHQDKMDNYFLNVAKLTSNLSYGKRAKVGAIVTKDERIISLGYNGTPPGFDNNLEFENEDGTLTTKPEVIHAEMNAICFAAKTSIELDRATIYLTLSPCHECAKLIIQCGIKRVVYIEKYRDTTGLEILQKAGIICEQKYIN